MHAGILCGGSGIRLRPITEQVPKCMVEVKGRPLLEWVMENMINAGVDEIHLVVGYKKEIIEDHFGPEFDGVKLNYFVQKEQKGTAHAVSLLQGYLKESFMLANGDVLASRNDYRELVRVSTYEEFDGLILARKVSDPWKYGVLKTYNYEITDIVEKPNPGKEPSSLINAGVYRFRENFFDSVNETPLSPRGEYELVDSIRHYIARGKRVEYRMCNDRCVDISTLDDLKNADEMDSEEFPH